MNNNSRREQGTLLSLHDMLIIWDYETYQDLYESYKRERSFFQRLNFWGNLIGYGTFFLYAFLLFYVKNLDFRFAIMDVFSIFTRFSLVVLFKYYSIPNICKYILSDEPHLVRNSYKTIDKHRPEILGCLFKNIYGIGYDRSLLESPLEKLQLIVREFSNPNMGKILKFYILFYASICLTFFGFLIYLTREHLK